MFGVTAILIVASTLFVFKEPLNPIPLACGVAVLCGSAFALGGRFLPGGKISVPLAIIAALIIILCASFFISGHFYDVSWDGLAYQQEGVIQLVKNKWNPFYEHTAALKPHPALWLDHYAKAPWILEGSLYAITGRIEYSKVFNIIFILISFSLAFSLLVQFEKIGRLGAFFLALLASLNPVVLAQFLTFYVDAQLACMLLALIALMLVYYRQPDPFILLGICAVAIILCSIKFTGIVYAFVLFSSFWAGLCVFKKRFFIRPLSYGFAAALIALFLVGFNPYVKNTIDHGNPLYPFFDKVEYDIMTENFSVLHVSSNNRFIKLAKSLFSSIETEDYKVPFSVSRKELAYFKLWDSRIEGFGPLFSGIFLISMIFIFITGVRLFITDRMLFWGFCYVLFVLLLSIFIIPESWWARYSPQLWLLPVISIIGFKYSTGKTVFAWIPGLLIAVNVILIGGEVLAFNISRTREIDAYLSSLERHPGPLQLYWGDCRFRALRFRLDERKIAYVEVRSPKELTYPLKMNFECAAIAVRDTE